MKAAKKPKPQKKFTEPFLYFKPLAAWDKVTISLYVLLSFGLVYWFCHTADSSTQRNILFWYASGTHFFLYIFNYASLRNLSVYLFWLLTGAVHLMLHLLLKDDAALQDIEGHATRGLAGTIPLLLLYQLMRFASLMVQKKELVVPAAKGSKTDIFDDREPSFLDFIFFAIYLATMLWLMPRP